MCRLDPTTADEGLGYVDASWSAGQQLLSSLTPDETWEPIGPIADPYAYDARIDLVVHVMDEFIRHAAEVGVMRDLYSAMPRTIGHLHGPNAHRRRG